jgi:hypothetical protein
MLGQAAAYTSCVCVCFANESEVDNYLHARVLSSFIGRQTAYVLCTGQPLLAWPVMSYVCVSNLLVMAQHNNIHQ